MVGDYSRPKPETQRKLNKVAAGLMEGKKKGERMAMDHYHFMGRVANPAQ